MNADILQQLFDKMSKSNGFPALESNVGLLVSALHEAPTDIEGLSNAITADFSLTHMVLQLVNSAMYAPFAKDVDSVGQAIRVLGIDALSHIALRVDVISDFSDDTQVMRELLLANSAVDIARETGVASEEAVSTATLINRVGDVSVSK